MVLHVVKQEYLQGGLHHKRLVQQRANLMKLRDATCSDLEQAENKLHRTNERREEVVSLLQSTSTRMRLVCVEKGELKEELRTRRDLLLCLEDEVRTLKAEMDEMEDALSESQAVLDLDVPVNTRSTHARTSGGNNTTWARVTDGRSQHLSSLVAAAGKEAAVANAANATKRKRPRTSRVSTSVMHDYGRSSVGRRTKMTARGRSVEGVDASKRLRSPSPSVGYSERYGRGGAVGIKRSGGTLRSRYGSSSSSRRRSRSLSCERERHRHVDVRRRKTYDDDMGQADDDALRMSDMATNVF